MEHKSVLLHEMAASKSRILRVRWWILLPRKQSAMARVSRLHEIRGSRSEVQEKWTMDEKEDLTKLQQSVDFSSRRRVRCAPLGKGEEAPNGNS